MPYVCTRHTDNGQLAVSALWDRTSDNVMSLVQLVPSRTPKVNHKEAHTPGGLLALPMAGAPEQVALNRSRPQPLSSRVCGAGSVWGP